MEAVAKKRFNQTSITLDINQSYSLKLLGVKDTIKWSTTNKKIATVNKNGKVTAVSNGRVIIRAKAGKKTYSCTVTVRKASINKASLTLGEGKTYTLRVKGIKGTVTWKSKNTKIATVNKNGKVTALKNGTVIISGRVNKVTLNCKVKVTHHHSYKSKVTRKPTCYTGGVLTYTCSCGYSHTEPIMPKEHTPSKWILESEATYLADGMYIKKCTECDSVIDCKVIPMIPHTHNYIKKVTIKPTCQSYGLEVDICSMCGYVPTSQYLTMLDHDFECVNHVDPTCTDRGYNTYKCKGCSVTKISDYISPLNHSYERISTSATCEESGDETYRCTRCDSTMQEYDKPSGHNYVEINRTKPTCTETGEIVRECTKCHKHVTETIKATGHSYGKWETILPTSYESFGSRSRECTKCGKEDKQLIIWVDYGDPDGEKHLVYGNFYMEYAKELFKLTNEIRVQNGRDELIWDNSLDNYTLIRATEAASREDWDLCHKRPNELLRGEGFAENITYNCGEGSTPQHALKCFVNSYSHYRCMLESFWNTVNMACFKFYEGGSVCYLWIQVFNIDKSLLPHVHSYTPQSIVRVEPTCTKDGSITKKCYECGEEEFEILPSYGHDFVKDDRNCIVPTSYYYGRDAYSCNHCNLSKVILIPRLGEEDSTLPKGYIDYEIRQTLIDKLNEEISSHKTVVNDLGSYFLAEWDLVDSIPKSPGYSSIDDLLSAWENSTAYQNIVHQWKPCYDLYLTVFVREDADNSKKYYFTSGQPLIY